MHEAKSSHKLFRQCLLLLLLWVSISSCHFGGLHYVPATGNIAIGRSIAASSTCGTSEPVQFCSAANCDVCDSQDETSSHPSKYMIDNSRETWWQSENNVDNVTIDINFKKTFLYTHILISFRSLRPAAMAIEKSTDGGRSYQTLRHYSTDCEADFGSSSSCTPEYTHPSSGEIIYQATAGFPEPNLTNTSHIDRFTVTNLKLHLLRLQPLSGNHPPSLEARERRYYAIDHIEVYGWCFCNGHESGCGQSTVEESTMGMVPSLCQCANGTAGTDCGECAPEYGNRSWSIGFRLSDTTAGCQECDCSGHSDRCYYDESVGHGVCSSCSDRTTGNFCEACAEGYYRNEGVSMRDSNTCIECRCNRAGVLPGTLCVQENSPPLLAGSCHCRPNVTGEMCDQCDQPGFLKFDPDSLTGPCQACSCPDCEPNTGRCPCNPLDSSCCPFDQYLTVTCTSCDCHSMGSLGVCHLNGKCVCKPGVGGAKCDRCLSGYYNLSDEGCTPCRCDVGGSTNQSCDSSSGHCYCRENVGGVKCDSCPPGSLGPVPNSAKPCFKCFCNGFSNQCQSKSGWYWAQAEDRFEESQSACIWKLTNNVQCNDEADQTQNFTLCSGAKTLLVNFPSAYLGDKRTSYGLYMDIVFHVPYDEDNEAYLEFVQSATGRRQPPLRLVRPLKLGKDGIMDYRIPLVEEEFTIRQYSYSVDADRRRMQMVLSSIKYIRLRVKFGKTVSTDNKCISISYVKLPYASQDVSHSLLLYPLTAAQVGEECSCPEAWTGSRCDSCSPNFTWDPSNGGEFAKCVRCFCYGRADTCDSKTNECSDCRENTAGTYCHQCASQHYWDPSTRKCRPCNCPGGPDTINQFGVSCSTDSMGDHVCNCLPGFSGKHCETCQTGFVGNPSYSNGTCRICSCNQNSGGGLDRCDSITGDCSCEVGYVGEECDLCNLGYYGNPIAHNCTSCGCGISGSVSGSYCNLVTGQCVCRENVIGRDCDQCSPGHWNLASGTGCQECGCSVLGSVTPTNCNQDSGQCDCKEENTGRTCGDCQDGYWKMEDGTCSPCNCQLLSSVSPVCDKTTGVCTCLEGVTGTKCDQCLTNVTTTGLLPYCELCDECSTQWDVPIDILEERVSESVGRGKNVTVRRVSHTEIEAGLELVNGLYELLQQIRYLIEHRITDYLRDLVDSLHFNLTSLISTAQNNLLRSNLLLVELSYTNATSTIQLDRLEYLESEQFLLMSLLKNMSLEIGQFELADFSSLVTRLREAVARFNESYRVATETVTPMVSQSKDNLRTFSEKEKLFLTISEEVSMLLGIVEGRLMAYEDLVRDATQRLCGGNTSAEVCESECGGVTCDICGGAGCGGSASNVSRAAETINEALKEVRRLRENLTWQISDLEKANVTSLEANLRHQRVQEKANVIRTSIRELFINVQNLDINALNVSNLPDLSNIGLLQHRALQLNISKTPEEVLEWLNNINETIEMFLPPTNVSATDLLMRAERALNLSKEANNTLTDILNDINSTTEKLKTVNARKMIGEQETRQTRKDLEVAENTTDQARNLLNMAEANIKRIQSRVQSLNSSLQVVRESFESNKQRLSSVRNASVLLVKQAKQLNENATRLSGTFNKLDSDSSAKLATANESLFNVTILRDQLIDLRNVSHTQMLRARGLQNRKECIIRRQSHIRGDIQHIGAELERIHNEIEMIVARNTICLDSTITQKK